MNVKNNVKKIIALGASVALVGTTLAGAMAYTLADYPQPFVMDGQVDGVIVVGHSAAMSDMVGAIDIAASIQASAVTTTSVAASGSVSLEGGEDFAIDMNEDYGSAVEYDEGDLEGFADDTVSINDSDIDYKEYLTIADTGVRIETSLDTGYKTEENYGTEPYMEIGAGDIGYYIEFEDGAGVAYTDVADEFEIDFLGKSIKIIGAGDGAAVDTVGTITVEASAEHFLIEGDMVEVEGKEVTLVRVGETSVIVSVDGQTKVIADGDDAEFDQADDFEVEVDSIFYDSGADDNGANLILGDVITKTYADGDALQIFDGEDDEDVADWVWSIVTNDATDMLESIGIINNPDFDYERTVAEDDDERVAFKMGEELMLPNEYAAIQFAGWDDNAMAKYDTLEISFDKEKLCPDAACAVPDATDGEVIKFTSSADGAFYVDSGDTSDYDEMLVYGTTGAIYYLDDGDYINSGETIGAADSFIFMLDDDEVEVTPVAGVTGDVYTINFMDGVTVVDTLTFETDATYTGFLADDANAAFDFTDADNTALSYDDDDNHRTTYGVYFEDMDNMYEDDEIVLNVPHARQLAQIVIKSQGTVTSAAAGGVSQVINPASLGLAVEDINAPTLGSKPMIVVGGPAINTVAAALMNNPTSEEIAASFEAGKAMIKFYGDHNAVLVAGYEAMETQGACNVLADYKTYDLTGDEMEVIVTDVNNVEVTPVN
ncbi:MAG: S-layer protein [Candidatus Woesearchaeota archaeon]